MYKPRNLISGVFGVWFGILLISGGSPAFGSSCAEFWQRQSIPTVWSQIPKSARELTGKKPNGGGPNCFNAVLLWFGNLSGAPIAQTGQHAFQEFLGRHFVRVDPGSSRELGDVLVVKELDQAGKPGDWLHASVWVEDGIVWQKKSMYAEQGWELTSFKKDWLYRLRFSEGELEVQVYRLLASEPS